MVIVLSTPGTVFLYSLRFSLMLLSSRIGLVSVSVLILLLLFLSVSFVLVTFSRVYYWLIQKLFVCGCFLLKFIYCFFFLVVFLVFPGRV